MIRMSDKFIAGKLSEEGWHLFVLNPHKTAEEIALEVAKNNGFEFNERIIRNLTWVLKGWINDID